MDLTGEGLHGAREFIRPESVEEGVHDGAVERARHLVSAGIGVKVWRTGADAQ
jgi:hypothetical protein